ncbi:Glycosyltransferase [Richelia intracellularis]|nr:Glycosyltransferase [Richelia intracellularis]
MPVLPKSFKQTLSAIRYILTYYAQMKGAKKSIDYNNFYMKILVASHTYIVDLNSEKLRILANLEPNIKVTVIVPKFWAAGGVQNKILETTFRD